jgi:hypothetical protein
VGTSSLARQTLEVIERGRYTAPSGHEVERRSTPRSLAPASLRPDELGPLFASLDLRSARPSIEVKQALRLLGVAAQGTTMDSPRSGSMTSASPWIG